MIRHIEELAINAWPSLQTSLYDGWVLRVSNGYTNRANSINPLYSSNIDLDEKIEYCRDFYEKLGLVPVYKILDAPEFEALDTKLSNLSYRKSGIVSIRIKDLTEESFEENPSTKVFYTLTNDWVEEYIKCTKMENKNNIRTLNLMLENIIGKVIGVIHKVDDQSVGCGFGVIDKGYVGIFNIHVEESYRGRGYGKAVMSKILQVSRLHGAQRAYLQVVSSNMVANNLYSQLGFEEIYRYWYRTHPCQF